jgi:DNA-binding NarL/FixJ family response regulator
MPGNGIVAAREIAERVPSTAIVMLTISRDDADLFEALRAGAAGYLLKDIDPDQLPEALDKVLAGEGALPGSLVAKLMDEFRSRGSGGLLQRRQQRGPELTQREWEVLELLSEGLLTSEIAHRLFISEVTVRTHVSSTLKKLRVPDRAAAVKLFEEQAAEGRENSEG